MVASPHAGLGKFFAIGIHPVQIGPARSGPAMLPGLETAQPFADPTSGAPPVYRPQQAAPSAQRKLTVRPWLLHRHLQDD